MSGKRGNEDGFSRNLTAKRRSRIERLSFLFGTDEKNPVESRG